MLTTDFVRNCKAPKTGATTYWDNDPRAPGFGLRVHAGGTKSFFLNYRFAGRERRYTIGTFPRWSVVAARDEAKELRKLIDKGHDPAGDKRERREAPTVQDLIDRYVNDHLPQKSIRGARLNDEKKMLAEIADKLGRHSKVTDIHGNDTADMHRKITESGRPVRANRILSIASKMFSLSLVPLPGENMPWRSAEKGNPCRGVARNCEDPHEHFFSQAELAKIADALNKWPGIAADCIRLIMLTGCRPIEAMKAQWEEFDKEPGFWVKPSAHTKQRKIHRLPLNPPGLELIERLRKKRKASVNWVFPGAKPGEHLTVLTRAWEFIRKETGLGKSRIYDLRHSFASVGAGGGLSLVIIGRLLGHSQAKTTARYAHLGDDPLREASAKIGSVIAGAGKPGDKIVTLNDRDAARR